MNQIQSNLYDTIKKLNVDVKRNLEKKGLVVPIQQQDGRIRLGYFIIQKEKTGFFSIVDNKNRVLVSNINLPHTAILIANKLALGKIMDKDLLNVDKKYGYAVFDEQLCKKHAIKMASKHHHDRAEVLSIKYQIAQEKKNYFKKIITSDYEKLIGFR